MDFCHGHSDKIEQLLVTGGSFAREERVSLVLKGEGMKRGENLGKFISSKHYLLLSDMGPEIVETTFLFLNFWTVL